MEEKRIFWTRLIGEHYASLMVYFRRRITRPEEVEDLVQETYLRLLRADHARVNGQEIQNPEAYLFTVAANLVREYSVLQRRFTRNVELEEVAPDLLAVDGTAESDMDRDILEQRLLSVLDRLSARYRAVVVMHYRDGLTYQEIAEKLGVSTHMVKKYVVKALAACRNGVSLCEYREWS
jgi:RNA polymerase sigma-70 factor (ECF subfamily)